MSRRKVRAPPEDEPPLVTVDEAAYQRHLQRRAAFKARRLEQGSLRATAAAMVLSPFAPAEEVVQQYRPQAIALLEKHGLRAPPVTQEMLARTIMRCHKFGPQRERRRAKQLSPRDRLHRTRTHAVWLIKYTERQPSRRDSIPTHAKALRKLLNDLDATVWLSTAPVRVQAPELLERLQANPLDRAALESLVMAIDSILAGDDDAVTGRPPNRLASVLNACCIAWKSAERDESYTWNDLHSRLTGPLVDFTRDVLGACGFEPMKDNALRQAFVRRKKCRLL